MQSSDGHAPANASVLRGKMTWLENLTRAVDYIESHIADENLSVENVAREAFISPFYFQRGFAIVSGYTLGEYIRNRRLYLASLEIAAGAKVLDTALKYCWESPEAFSKAFSRFHGYTPQQVKGDSSRIKVFLPIKISVTITGGFVTGKETNMEALDFTVQKRFAFKVIGFKRRFNMETSYEEIPKFWNELTEKYCKTLYAKLEKGEEVTDPIQKAIADNCIGEYGICIDTCDGSEFDYMVAGRYTGGEVPAGMEVFEIPVMDWAIFNCTGAIPKALQNLNTRIFKEWLPTNGKYEIAAGYNIEWYDTQNGEMSDPDYKSAIWVPVKEK